MDTAGCRIDVKNGKLSLDVEDEHVEFNLIKASKFPSITRECCRIDAVDSLAQKAISNNVSCDPLEHCLLNNGTTGDENL